MPLEPTLEAGRIVAAHGRHVMVETDRGQRVLCHARGKKNDLVVGDLVQWQRVGDGGVVEKLQERRNLLFRQDAWRTKSFAANLDQILVLAAAEPVFSESQLTRALIAARAAGIPALIGLNKTDLPQIESARARLAPYQTMGATVIELAFKADPEGSRQKLQQHLADKVTLILGPSGVGKSSMINLLVPHAAALVNDISRALNTGRHTTTTSTWYWMDAAHSAALIDSPGFQEFGLMQIKPEDLASLMPDYAAAMGQCRFHNCSHRHEPDCGVQQACEAGLITPSRQRIYASLFEELSRQRW